MKLTTHAIVQPELKALIIPLQDYWSHINPIELSRVCLTPAHEHQSDGVSFAQQTARWWHKYQKELTDFFANPKVLHLLGDFRKWLLRQSCEFEQEGGCVGSVVIHGNYPYCSPRCWHHDLDDRLSHINWLLRFGLQTIASHRHSKQIDIDHVVSWAVINHVADLLPERLVADFNQVPLPSIHNQMVPMPTDILARHVKPIDLTVEPEPPAMFMGKPKAQRFQNEKYLQFVRSLPCAITGKCEGVEAHHLIGHGVSAMGTKTHDLFTFPLSHDEHMNLHQIGWQAWEKQHSSQIEYVFRTLMKACELGVFN